MNGRIWRILNDLDWLKMLTYLMYAALFSQSRSSNLHSNPTAHGLTENEHSSSFAPLRFPPLLGSAVSGIMVDISPAEN